MRALTQLDANSTSAAYLYRSMQLEKITLNKTHFPSCSETKHKNERALKCASLNVKYGIPHIHYIRAY